MRVCSAVCVDMIMWLQVRVHVWQDQRTISSVFCFFQEPFPLLFESRLLIALALAHMAGLAGKQPPIPTSRDLPVPVYLIIGLQTSRGTSSFKKKNTH